MPLWSQNRKTTSMIMSQINPSSNVGSMNKKPMSEDNGELDVSSGMESAANNMMEAFHRKDVKRLVQALCDFMELHRQHEESESNSIEDMESRIGEKY